MENSNSPKLDPRERKIRQRLKSDFAHYAPRCLKIRTKDGSIDALALNTAQRHIHAQLEGQKASTGRVRAIILKGRQQGCSTYVEGRFYWLTSHSRGKRAFILTHEQDATDNLFEIATRYHEHCPALVRPHTGAANAKELHFDVLDSGYRVATAGNKGAGRSSTVQMFHGSEVAYWPNADVHAAGVMQAIPDAPDTEVILESTANGQGNYYHQAWLRAQRGEGDFIAIFVPWFWQEEYRRSVGEEFKPASDEGPLVEAHGLDNGQLAWRRAKIQELGGGTIGEEMFRREYPCTPEEAFLASLEDVVMTPTMCAAARNRDVQPSGMHRPIWGVDVARFGDDRTTLAKRQSNVQLEPVKSWRGKDTMQTAGLIKAEWDALDPIDRPSEILVDVIGLGAGVVDRLRELALPVRGVNVAESASIEERYMRLRDELWFKGRDWLTQGSCKLADDEALIAELTGPKYEITSGGKIKVESKDEMKKRGLQSPDLADAWLLTFAGGEELRNPDEFDRYARKKRNDRGSWMAA